MGNPKFIPTKGMKTVATDIMNKFEASKPEPFLGKETPDFARVPEYGAKFKKGDEFSDPFIDTINKIRGLDDYITPTEYQGLMKTMERDFVNSGMEDPTGMFFSLNSKVLFGKSESSRLINFSSKLFIFETILESRSNSL